MGTVFEMRIFCISKMNRGTLLKLNIIAGFGVKGSCMLLSLLFIPLVLSYLTSYKYGIWLTINSVISWFSMLDVGLSGGLRFKLQESLSINEIILSKKYISTTYFSLLGISIVACVLTITCLKVIDPNYSSFFKVSSSMENEIRTVIYFTICCFFIRFILQPITSILQADQMNFITGLLQLSESIINLIGIYLLYIHTSGSLLYACVVFAITPIVNLLIFSLLLFSTKYKKIKPELRYVGKTYFKSLFGIGVDFFITSISIILLIQCNNIVIVRLFTPNEVTEYNLIFKLFSTVSLLFTLVMSPMWSAFANAYNKGEINWIINVFLKIKKVYYFTIIIYFLLVFCSKYIIKIWCNLDIDKIDVALFCALYFIIQNLQMIYAYLFNSTGLKKLIKMQRNIAIFGALVNIPLIFCMVEFLSFGLSAVPIGNLISVLPALFIYPNVAKKLFAIK